MQCVGMDEGGEDVKFTIAFLLHQNPRQELPHPSPQEKYVDLKYAHNATGILEMQMFALN